ncbi:MAG TPA: hypothetical protein VG604_01705 [Candidatus Saccharimonadales bacterium]|nr:hypothetical protein [Candidatus Saccharimonadales bacterium]
MRRELEPIPVDITPVFPDEESSALDAKRSRLTKRKIFTRTLGALELILAAGVYVSTAASQTTSPPDKPAPRPAPLVPILPHYKPKGVECDYVQGKNHLRLAHDGRHYRPETNPAYWYLADDGQTGSFFAAIKNATPPADLVDDYDIRFRVAGDEVIVHGKEHFENYKFLRETRHLDMPVHTSYEGSYQPLHYRLAHKPERYVLQLSCDADFMEHYVSVKDYTYQAIK